jgi:phage/plasmid-associated DNA primase
MATASRTSAGADSTVSQETVSSQISKSESSEAADFRYGQTDLGAAERFVRQHGANLRYAVETKNWHRYDGARWEPDTLNQVYQLAKQTVKTMYAEMPLQADAEKRKALYKFIQKCESERSLNAMVNLAKTDPKIVISVADFDSNRIFLIARTAQWTSGPGSFCHIAVRTC